MNYIIDKAREAYGDNLSLFTVPEVNTAIESVYTKQYNSIGKISKGSTIEFDVQNTSTDYISLKDTSLSIKLTIETDKNASIKATDNVALINLPAATIFRQVDVTLQQQNLTASIGGNYPYKAILDVLMKYGTEAQSTWLKTTGFEKDFSGAMDSFEPKASLNGGLKERYTLTAEGKEARLCTNLFVDVFDQERLLINNVPINIKLHPHNSNFCLMYKNPAPASLVKSYNLNIKDVQLNVTYVKLNPSLLMSQSHDLRRESALYPYERSAIKAFNISQGTGDWSMDNIFLDNIPDTMYVCMLDSDAYNGNNQKNPFNFKNMALNFIQFAVNGLNNEMHTFEPSFVYQHNNKTLGFDDYYDSYLSIFRGKWKKSQQLPFINDADFKSGFCIHKFDVTNKDLSLLATPMRKGQTRLTLRFSITLPSTITVLVYGIFNSLLKIEESRNILIQT